MSYFYTSFINSINTPKHFLVPLTGSPLTSPRTRESRQSHWIIQRSRREWRELIVLLRRWLWWYDGVMVCRKTPHLLCGLLAAVLTGKSPWWTQITDYTFLAVKSFLLVKTNITKLSLSLTDEGSLSSSIQPSASNRSKTKANILMYNRGELSTIFPYW